MAKKKKVFGENLRSIPSIRKLRPTFKQVNRAIIIFFLLSAALLTAHLIGRWKVVPIPPNITQFLATLTVIAFTFFITSFIARITGNRVFDLFNRFGEVEQAIFLTKVYTSIIYTVGVLYIIYRLGVSLDNITLLAGLITTGLAFALREILVSYFIWGIILRKKPFRIGDTIHIGEVSGEVTRIGTFFITVHDEDGVIHKIPNKNFLDKTTQNFHSQMRDIVKVPVKKIPNDCEKRIAKVEKALAKVHDRINGRATYALEGVTLSFQVSFSSPLKEHHEVRTKVIKIARDACKGIEK